MRHYIGVKKILWVKFRKLSKAIFCALKPILQHTPKP